MGISGFTSWPSYLLDRWIFFPPLFCLLRYYLHAVRFNELWSLYTVMLHCPNPFYSFFMLQFTSSWFSRPCRIWLEPGTLLILQAKGEVRSGQQTSFEPLCVRHFCRVQGILSSWSFCTCKCKPLQKELVCIQSLIYTLMTERISAY